MKSFHLSLCFVLLLPLSALAAGKIEKESIAWQGKNRTYYLFVPETAKPAPLLLLLHGSHSNGLSLVEQWKDLAEKEGIILVGPNAKEVVGWGVPATKSISLEVSNR
jgi:poly(3-hydroxybutyrate) depolymerase